MISKIEIAIGGYVACKSEYYRARDVLQEKNAYIFQIGMNLLRGDIDSGNFGISYLLSNYDRFDKLQKSSLELPHVATVDGIEMPLAELTKHCSYIDRTNPLFASKASVRALVAKGLKKSEMNMSVEEVKELFMLSDHRFDYPVCGNGNERCRAMGAIAYAYGKDVFCFPWYSKRTYDAYQRHMPWLMEKLTELKKIVILPLGELP